MNWKNYNEISPEENQIGSKYLLNLDENIDDTSNNQENIQERKNYIDKYFIDNMEEGNDKMNYYFLLNNIEDENNDYNNYNNNKFESIKPSINFQNFKNSDSPFINEEELNKLYSDSNNNENKDQSKKNIFKIQSICSTSKGDSSQNLINNKDYLSEENNNEYNYQNIPLKERMRIKKQKTKKLLENKTQRTTIKEESKENISEKNEVSNNTLESNLGYTENINNTSNINSPNMNNLNPNFSSKMSKKEIKMLRNRQSAQRSRDRKKKELFDLKTITKNLLQENEKLRNDIKERDNKIKFLLNQLCPNCREKINKNNLEINIENKINQSNNLINDESQLTSSSIMAGKKKLALLMTGLFTIFCIFGSFIPQGEQNILRQLKENNNIKNKTNDFNNEKRVNVPFIIEKDYTLRHKKEIEMNQKIQRNNLKNKNLMVPASLFQNNSEQIISNINNSINKSHNNSNNNKLNNITDNYSIKRPKNNNTQKNNIGEKRNDIEKENLEIKDN